MVKSVDSGDLNNVYNFCKGSVLGIKITCQLKVYGTDRSFLNCWATYNDGRITAIICKFEEDITLLCDMTGNPEEIRTFVDMLGFSSLCCSFRNAEYLGFESTAVRKAYIYNLPEAKGNAEKLSADCYREAYKLISCSIPDSFKDTKEAYLCFLSDLTYRMNRNMARFTGITDDNKVIACALTSAETETDAIISGVACDGNYRGGGYGKRVVMYLCSQLIKLKKKPHIIALNESAEGFYEHLGFTFYEKISFVERK